MIYCIFIYHGVEIKQPSAIIEQNSWFPQIFHIPLNHFITAINYLKVFRTPYYSSTASTSPYISISIALFGCILNLIHPQSPQNTKFNNPNNNLPLSISLHSHMYLHNCKGNMVMVYYCTGFILKEFCMVIRSTRNPPCPSC